MPKTFTLNGRRPRVLLEDRKALHQITLAITGTGSQLVVSCTCLVRGGRPPLASAPKMSAEESLAIWKQHRDQVGLTA